MLCLLPHNITGNIIGIAIAQEQENCPKDKDGWTNYQAYQVQLLKQLVKVV